MGRAIKLGAREPAKWRYSLFKQRLLPAYLIRGNWPILVCFEGNLSTFDKIIVRYEMGSVVNSVL